MLVLPAPLARPNALTVTVTEVPPPALLAEWARLVAGSPSGDVAQLPQWARVRGTVGFTARYVLVSGPDGGVLGGAQVLERSVPVLGRIGYVPYGPVLAAGVAEPAMVHAAVCDALAELELRCDRGRRLSTSGVPRRRHGNLRMLFVQPPPGGEATSENLLARGFRPSTANIAPGQTLRLDLTRELPALRSGLSRRLRTWTNRWAARGVAVRRGTAADVGLLAELVARSGEHQGFAAVSAGYLATLLRELTEEHAVLFVGSLPGRAELPVAAALYTRCGETLTLRFAGMDRDDEAARLNVPAAIQWHAIEWAKRAGLRWFDFGGVTAQTAAALTAGAARDQLRGVDRFKVSFGGAVCQNPPAVELIPNPVLRACYDLLRRTDAGRWLVIRAKAVLRTGRLR